MSEKFGRYQLLTRIGSGGMAEVFRARLEAPGGAEKILVIKRIRPSLCEEPSFLRLFVDEARIALPLTHDNITSVFEFGEVDGQYFLAMEHIHGQNLGSVLRQVKEAGEKLPPALALFIAAEVAKGLAYAHGFLSQDGTPLEVVHLDVSPQNILLSYDGAVKLTDFGIARVLGGWGEPGADASPAADRADEPSDATAAAPGEGSDRSRAEPSEAQAPLLGKASYLAPEQVRRGPVDARTDVYALGCVLYECLVGEPPHGRGNDQETLGRVHAGSFERPSRIDPALAPFEPVLLRALAPDPDARFSSAAELHAALAKLLYTHAPGIDSPQLASWMRSSFADELQPNGRTADRRKHILQQLEAAGFLPEGDATVDLLDSATVALPGLPEPPLAEKRKARRLSALGAATITLFVLGGVTGARLLHAPAAEATAPMPVAATGSLSLHSWPSATVEIDGVLQSGQTPMLDVELAAGEHRVVFRHAELDLRREVEVLLEPGGKRTVVVTLGR